MLFVKMEKPSKLMLPGFKSLDNFEQLQHLQGNKSAKI